MTRPLTLLTIHAHPDDETISTGGVMARYLDEGLRVVCLTSNLGEHGEIVVPELDTPENHARLAAIRGQELAEALRRLGGVESRLLGYEDSGMMGTPDNDDPASFWQADLDEAIGRTVRVVREVKPDVVIGYNDFGGYGHPDHIRAAMVAKAAYERAGDAGAYPEQAADGLEPWAPSKLYYDRAFSPERFRALHFALEESGLQSPYAERIAAWLETDAEGHTPPAPTHATTTQIECGDYFEARDDALRAHRTQVDPEGFFFAVSPAMQRRVWPWEDYSLIQSRVPADLPEKDFFAGLR